MPRFDAIGFVVDDMESTLEFYRLLGLEFPAEPAGHVETMGPGGIRLMFDTVDVVRSFSTWDQPVGGHRVAIAFVCDSPQDVDATHDRLVAAGHPSTVAPFDAPWGQRYATVADPNGVPVDLFAPLA